jgi:hypothetical protein
VSSDRKLLTNYLVNAHAKHATVRFANGDAYDTVVVLSVDKRKDIAFLKIHVVVSGDCDQHEPEWISRHLVT